MNLKGATAFVTGGTGFIGGRLIEVLTDQYQMKVRALIRNSNSVGGSYRAAGCGAELIQGDLTDVEAMTSAVRGCDYVFHCAFGTSGDPSQDRHITIDGTTSLARAAASNGVHRFVNLSTMVVFGDTPAEADESYAPRKMWDWPYAHHKLAAEKALLAEVERSALSVKTLRLGTVYGPWGAAFTYYPIAALKSGQVVLVDEGRGLSNAVYVDDVIQAIILAARRDESAAETFIIRGPDRVTWRQFYDCYEAMLGSDSLVSMSLREVRDHQRKQQQAALVQVLPAALRVLKSDAGFKSLAGRLPLVRPSWNLVRRYFKSRGAGVAHFPATTTRSAERPLNALPEMMWGYYASQTEFSIGHARAILGYQPEFDLNRGMALTEEWATWAGLVPGK